MSTSSPPPTRCSCSAMSDLKSLKACKVNLAPNAVKRHGFQMAIARFLDHMCLALRASGLWLRYATLQNLIPSLPWIAPPRPTPSTLAQSKERKGSNFAIWQHCTGILELGTVYSDHLAVPPRAAEFEWHGHCLAECTAQARGV